LKGQGASPRIARFAELVVLLRWSEDFDPSKIDVAYYTPMKHVTSS
jgi:hypothetical protein